MYINEGAEKISVSILTPLFVELSELKYQEETERKVNSHTLFYINIYHSIAHMSFFN